MTGYIQIMTTTGARAEADQIARLLVERRLAACVQVLGPIESVYRWQEKIETSQEWLCLIKSKQSQFPAVEQAIREVHSYKVPEIIALPITAGNPAYLKWLHDEVRDD